MNGCVWILALAVLGCSDRGASSDPAAAPPPVAQRPAPPWTAAAIAHAGRGTPPDLVDGPRAAVDAALEELARSNDPLAAAVAGVVVMEDDPRFNAGTGSRVRLDLETVQMDAAAMTSAGDFGAVAVIEAVKNPVLVARAVMDTPHNLLAGDGATRFARTLGMPEYDPATDAMRARTVDIIARLQRADPTLAPSWQSFDWRSRWNFDKTLEQAGLTTTELGSDTVGVAVRAVDGRFAVALSTGGTPITLRGRIGDVPILGAGLFTGDAGAIAATGAGERIMAATLSRRVHEWLAAGVPLADALARGVAEMGEAGDIGLIGVTANEMTAASDGPMAWAAREQGSPTWHGP